ncbi:eukaryotic translation initiation factor 4E-binding protein 3 [Contarinia nasturtii]|uniref:eukaryotic translation initiation factor 4E-binding protein 3 n=1 Tax=Contarinia nasturtii TaxID=265458 RepID=UPI0012D37925|nr:eukaryotic translation initiation factor 4E-binding protein 3 [Contarinia nasturtii]
MSASPIARTLHQSIPSKKVLINDPNQLPDVYSSTPGGTIFSTTPGGTRIIYERAFLMNLKNSPLSRTPPSNLPSTLIKGCKNVPMSKINNNNNNRHSNSISRSPPSHKTCDEQQFDMDL